MDITTLKKSVRNHNCRYFITSNPDKARAVNLLKQDKRICYANIWSSYDNSGFKGYHARYKNVRTVTFTNLIWGECWDYKKRYLHEVTELFKPLIGPIEIIPPEKDESGIHGRYIFKVKMNNDTEKTVLHAYMVFMRHTWEWLHKWPVLKSPPSMLQVWKEHVMSAGKYGLGHTNFYRVDSPYRNTPAGWGDKTYVEQVPDVWRRWPEMKKAHFSHEGILDRYTPEVKSPMAYAALQIYKESINDKSKTEVFDPFTG